MPQTRHEVQEFEPQLGGLWDMSPDVQRKRFQGQLQDQEWRTSTTKWYQTGKDLVIKKKLPLNHEHGSLLNTDTADRTELYYLRHILEEAMLMIDELIPGSFPYLADISKRLAIYSSNQNDPIAYSMIETSGVYRLRFILPPKTESSNFFDESHSLRLILIIHELLHALLTERYRLTFVTSLDKNEVGLSAVLHEMGVYAFMPEIVYRMTQSTKDKTGLVGLKNHFQTIGRLVSKYNVMRKNPQAIGELRERAAQGSPLAANDLENLRFFKSYIPGYQIVARLEKNGWRYNHFPILVKKIEAILREELGRNYLNKIGFLVLDDPADPRADRILARIRALKP